MAELSVTGLRVLRTVAAKGSFTAAAESLGYTQSAVSRQVAALESAAGAPLFERNARGVRATDAGRVLLRHADALLDEVDAARRELQGVTVRSGGRLRLGAFPTASAALLPRTLAAFRAAHSDVETSLREGGSSSQIRRLLSGSADVAVLGVLPEGRPTRDRRLTVEHLLDDPLLLAVGRAHPLARSRTVDLDDLASEGWIAASSKASDTMLGAWQWADWQPQVEFVAREWTAKLGLVAAGLGVTLVPGLAANAVRPDVAVVRIRSERPVSREVSVATRTGEGHPLVPAFVDLLHDAAAELTAELQRRVSATTR
jgi:DNA-binding transcriptional LysR family regulator